MKLYTEEQVKDMLNGLIGERNSRQYTYNYSVLSFGFLGISKYTTTGHVKLNKKIIKIDKL